MAKTDVVAALAYEQQIREFHRSLRMFYYPWLTKPNEHDKSRLQDLPQFEHNKTNY
jgi:ABC-2 type transport system permease protein